MTVQIDFSKIQNMEAFYDELQNQINLPDYFGRNLDALYDMVSGELELPLNIHFINMNLDQLETFDSLIQTMCDLQEELEEFGFRYAIRI